jgi:hypothetical protein
LGELIIAMLTAGATFPIGNDGGSAPKAVEAANKAIAAAPAENRARRSPAETGPMPGRPQIAQIGLNRRNFADNTGTLKKRTEEVE